MQVLYIHPENPEARLIEQAGDLLRKDQVIIYPSDNRYAYGVSSKVPKMR